MNKIRWHFDELAKDIKLENGIAWNDIVLVKNPNKRYAISMYVVDKKVEYLQWLRWKFEKGGRVINKDGFIIDSDSIDLHIRVVKKEAEVVNVIKQVLDEYVGDAEFLKELEFKQMRLELAILKEKCNNLEKERDDLKRNLINE